MDCQCGYISLKNWMDRLFDGFNNQFYIFFRFSIDQEKDMEMQMV